MSNLHSSTAVLVADVSCILIIFTLAIAIRFSFRLYPFTVKFIIEFCNRQWQTLSPSKVMNLLNVPEKVKITKNINPQTGVSFCLIEMVDDF